MNHKLNRQAVEEITYCMSYHRTAYRIYVGIKASNWDWEYIDYYTDLIGFPHLFMPFRASPNIVYSHLNTTGVISHLTYLKLISYESPD